jgi:hypothetical protein
MAISFTASTKPEIESVSDLLDNVMAGQYRVPRFQRPYVWTPDDMIQLFDSVQKGYPIGSLLIWQTDRSDINSLRSIGPIELPASGPSVKSYVVDGHQRLATLLGVLRLPEDYPRDRLDDWRWWIAYDLKKQDFVHVKGGEVIPLHLLPLRSVLRTVDFARRTREIVSSEEYAREEADQLLDRADEVQRAIRDYRVPLTVMRHGSLDDAVTIFSRVNQRGRDMTPDQMVSALTFRETHEGAFNLSDRIDDVLLDLRSGGFGDLERRIVLQAILAIAGMDFTRPTYERIVDRESYKSLVPAVDRAGEAMRSAVGFLRRIGVKTSRLLPYSGIMLMLSIYFDEAARRSPDLGDASIVEQWFWATSFNGWFAGANTTDLRQAGDVMRALARGEETSESAVRRFFFGPPIRGFPESFDRRSARIRASLLVQAINGRPLDPSDGEEIDVAAVFADESSRNLPYFFPHHRKPLVSNPANRVILPGNYGRNARSAFLNIAPSIAAERVFASHFIDQRTFDALRNDHFEVFIKGRERSILDAEDSFLRQFGLSIDLKARRDVEEIDNED